jgi:hypothetical protein
MKKLLSFIFSAIFIVLIGGLVAEMLKVNAAPVVAVLAVIYVIGLFVALPRGALLATLAPRNWANLPKDNTSRLQTNAFQDAIVVAAPTAVTTSKVSRETVRFATIAVATPTINLTVTGQKDLDEITLMLTADGTQRVVTLGTGTLSAGTLTIPASKTAVWRGVFDADLSAYREIGRAITTN